MTTELTQEEIVTNILSSNEILKRNNANFYITSPTNLGEYLNNVSKEIKDEKDKSFALSNREKVENFKYTFIKNGGWKI